MAEVPASRPAKLADVPAAFAALLIGIGASGAARALSLHPNILAVFDTSGSMFTTTPTTERSFATLGLLGLVATWCRRSR
jgi:hypothetical protein